MKNLTKIFKTVKPFLGRLEIDIDRRRQLIYFKRNGQTEILTVNQLFDQIESVFVQAKTTAHQRGSESIQLERTDAPWLPARAQPAKNPLEDHGQAVTESTRPLTALWG